MMKLKFPILTVDGETQLIPSRRWTFEKFVGEFLEPGLVHLKGAAQEDFRMTGFLDSTGRYFTVSAGKLQKPWLARFARIWDLTSMDCKVSDGRVMTVSELQELAKSWKNQEGRLFRKFLARQEPEAIFDAVMFRQVWETYFIEVPDDEWGDSA